MEFGSLLAFLGVAVLVTITPGQDMALVLRNTLMTGRRSGFVTSAGVVSGLVVWAVVASAGLTALLLSSEPLFMALKIGGALYLAYLGIQSLVSALRPGNGDVVLAASCARRSVESAGDRSAFRQGILSNLGNPKVAIFYSSLLPQFAGEGAGFGSLLSLGLLHCLLALVWLTGYALVLDRAGTFMRRARVRRSIEALTGFVLVGLALRLATERR